MFGYISGNFGDRYFGTDFEQTEKDVKRFLSEPGVCSTDEEE